MDKVKKKFTPTKLKKKFPFQIDQKPIKTRKSNSPKKQN